MANMFRRRRLGNHRVVRRTGTLVIANYATLTKPVVPLPGKMVESVTDANVRVEDATGNLRGIIFARARNTVTIEIRSIRGEQAATSLGTHTQAQVAGALADHATADVAGALLDHPVHGHDITTVAPAGAGLAMLDPAAPGPLEAAAGGQTDPNAVDMIAAVQAHAAGAAALAHAAGAAALAHATVADAYGEDREIADQAIAATITVDAPVVQ